MKKYDSYKDSGFELIGEVPSHWEVKRLKNIGELYSGLSGKSGGDFVSSSQKGYKPFINFTNIANNKYIVPDNFGYVKIESDEKQNRVRKNDLFFLMSSENREDLGKSALLIDDYEELYLNSFCKGFRITSDLNAKYINYLLNSSPLSQLISLEGRGFTRINLRMEGVENLPIVIPPSQDEQTQIANYLDQKTAQIDSLISNKEKLIELLKEERTAVINQAVTKGLDPNVPMKDSGIEWLGEIPEHWEVKKLKFLFSNRNSIRIPLSAEERGRMKIRKYDYYGASGVIDKVQSYLFDDENILIGEDGANLLTRSKRLAFIASGKYWVNNHAHIIQPKNGNINYYCELLELIDYTIWITGSAQPKLTQEALMNIELIEPPKEEQNEIALFINESNLKIDILVSKLQQEIDLLKEYKTALISEVVTGKVKVF